MRANIDPRKRSTGEEHQLIYSTVFSSFNPAEYRWSLSQANIKRFLSLNINEMHLKLEFGTFM